MSLISFWKRRSVAVIPNEEPTYVEWFEQGNYHVFAMTHPTDWTLWCAVKPGEAYNIERPERGWPAEEATVMPFREEKITCKACLFMWRLVKSRCAEGLRSTSFLGTKPK